MEFFFFFQFDLEHSVTKSSPEACDLHANCLLKLKLVSVSMTMNKSYIVVELNINLASTSVWQHQPWYGETMRPIGIWHINAVKSLSQKSKQKLWLLEKQM